jgi:plasmid stabilization system protein ParE
MSKTGKLSLVWSATARNDLIRLREFIQSHNPRAAKQSSEKILKAVGLIVDNPAIGMQVEGRQDYELVILFGQNSYILRYQIIEQKIVILKIWHSREDR